MLFLAPTVAIIYDRKCMCQQQKKENNNDNKSNENNERNKIFFLDFNGFSK